ncbi:hypothetical protein CEY16_01155 [Halalkalibacillus sediminis]|uniref:Lipoprotein n=1 Tax=Halalkalibacillus sediminis TaxID=2018042 RepID=A0A2I0QVQ2_9BACI|nr:hypothetical protein [Halalkalibacillus sediminis]PKR78394.1 hypothetical protein CEY16_01155 [Halalkalibacillus sediminis]
MKRLIILIVTFIAVTLISVGCSDLYDKDKRPTISMNPDSEYIKTFEDLSLGILFDFEFYLPEADQRWVNLWVEKYENGKKASEPFGQLTYDLSPQEESEDHLGFGMINPNSEDTSLFLYGPGVKSHSSITDTNINNETGKATSWGYALGDEEELKLNLGEPTILATYRKSKDGSISTVDLKDEESIENMISENEFVLLLKIEVTEEKNE